MAFRGRSLSPRQLLPGLFACAPHAIVRFVGVDDPAGPDGQLDAVLHLALLTRSQV